MGNKKTAAAAVDPRSLMTDRKKFMTRSFHAPNIISKMGKYIAQRDDVGAMEAARRALRFFGYPDHYSVETDETMRKCVELIKNALGK